MRMELMDIQSRVEICQQKVRAAQIAHGLDPEDSKVKGEWVDGPNGYKVWRMKQPATSNPEEMAKRKIAREKDRANSSWSSIRLNLFVCFDG